MTGDRKGRNGSQRKGGQAIGVKPQFARAARAAYAEKPRRLRAVGKKEAQGRAVRPGPAPRSLDDEIWEDYQIKAAGLLAEWRRKWGAHLS